MRLIAKQLAFAGGAMIALFAFVTVCFMVQNASLTPEQQIGRYCEAVTPPADALALRQCKLGEVIKQLHK